MLVLVLLCFVIYLAAYFCLKEHGQPMEVRPIRSIDDYFIQSKEENK
jgi:hypothetical protein